VSLFWQRFADTDAGTCMQLQRIICATACVLTLTFTVQTSQGMLAAKITEALPEHEKVS
jgi:hypothetical protein